MDRRRVRKIGLWFCAEIAVAWVFFWAMVSWNYAVHVPFGKERQVSSSLEQAASLAWNPSRLLARKVEWRIHEVRPGENFWSIAKENSTSLYTLIGANPNMPFTAPVGYPLVILSRRGVLHVVQKGETPASIAADYGLEVSVLQKENRLVWWRPLREGDVLFLPNVKPKTMPEKWAKYFENRGIFSVPFARWGEGWTSGFGVRKDPLNGETRMHKGMDFRANYGEDVFASATGVVIFAGEAGGYGKLIKIKHEGGYQTYYGHLSEIHVRMGQKVYKGQRIGKVGATGRVTGPHLHFEIRKNGKALDPLPLI